MPYGIPYLMYVFQILQFTIQPKTEMQETWNPRILQVYLQSSDNMESILLRMDQKKKENTCSNTWLVIDELFGQTQSSTNLMCGWPCIVIQCG